MPSGRGSYSSRRVSEARGLAYIQDKIGGLGPVLTGPVSWDGLSGVVRLAGRAAVGVDPDEAVMPRIAFGVVACPVAAVLRDALLEPVPGALGEPQ